MPPDDLREPGRSPSSAVGRRAVRVAELGGVGRANRQSRRSDRVVPLPDRRPASTRRLAWPLAAAAVLVALVAGGVLFGVPLAQRAGPAEARAAELNALAAATQRLAARSDATRVDAGRDRRRGTGHARLLARQPGAGRHPPRVSAAPATAGSTPAGSPDRTVSGRGSGKMSVGRRPRLLGRLVRRARRGGARDDVRGDPRGRCGRPVGPGDVLTGVGRPTGRVASRGSELAASAGLLRPERVEVRPLGATGQAADPGRALEPDVGRRCPAWRSPAGRRSARPRARRGRRGDARRSADRHRAIARSREIIDGLLRVCAMAATS